MIRIFNFLVSFFVKSKQFPKPFLGISWEEFDVERKEINQFIKLINDYKITSGNGFTLQPTLFFRVLEINKKIDSILDTLENTSSAIEPLKKMRTSCQRFMNELLPMDITNNQHQEVSRNFVNTIKIQCAVLIDCFWIELDENFEELEINTSLI